MSWRIILANRGRGVQCRARKIETDCVAHLAVPRGKAGGPADATSEVEQRRAGQRLELPHSAPQPIGVRPIDVFAEVILAVVELAECRAVHARGT